MRIALAILAATGLSGCAVEAVYAPLSETRARAYAAPGPATITLVTMIDNLNGSGAHSALILSGSQRVIFDPAGTFRHPLTPERGDVLYGITPRMLDVFVDYLARPRYSMVRHTLAVDRATADRAIALAEARGPVARAACGTAVSGLLRALGYASVGRSLWPKAIMHDVAALPGAREEWTHDATDDVYSPETRDRAAPPV